MNAAGLHTHSTWPASGMLAAMLLFDPTLTTIWAGFAAVTVQGCAGHPLGFPR